MDLLFPVSTLKRGSYPHQHFENVLVRVSLNLPDPTLKYLVKVHKLQNHPMHQIEAHYGLQAVKG